MVLPAGDNEDGVSSATSFSFVLEEDDDEEEEEEEGEVIGVDAGNNRDGSVSVAGVDAEEDVDEDGVDGAGTSFKEVARPLARFNLSFPLAKILACLAATFSFAVIGGAAGASLILSFSFAFCEK